MVSSAFWIMFSVIAILVVAVCIIFLFSGRGGEKEDTEFSINARNSVVTVRKVGAQTKVIVEPIAEPVDEGESVDLESVESTRKAYPVLYEEYMSDSTPARRKYEILEQLSQVGYVLPYIEGLHDKYRREIIEEYERIRKTVGGAKEPGVLADGCTTEIAGSDIQSDIVSPVVKDSKPQSPWASLKG